MEHITGDYKTLIEKCVAFAAQFICIPPTELLFDDCPSNRFPTMSNAAESSASIVLEYSRAMKSHFRKFGNQMSGSGNHLCNYASLLA